MELEKEDEKEEKEASSISFKQVIKHYASHITGIKWIGVVAFFLVIGFNAMQRWIGPLFVERSIDYTVTNLKFPTLVFVGMILMYVTTRLAWTVIDKITIKFQAEGTQQLREYALNELLRRNIHFFHKESHGKLITKFGRYIRVFEDMYDLLAFEIAWIIIPVVIAVIVVTAKLPLLGLFLLAWSIIFTYVTVSMRKSRDKIEQEEVELDSAFTGKLSDVLSNIFAVLGFGKQHSEIKRTSDASRKHINAMSTVWLRSNYERTIMRTLTVMLEGTSVFVSLYALAHQQVSLGEFVIIQGYVIAINENLWNVGRMVQRLSKQINDARAFINVLQKSEHQIDVLEVVNPGDPLIGAINLDHVSYQYPSSETLALNDMTLNIPYGQKVGIVGETGAGKSTLIQLLLGLITPEKGTFAIGATNIADIPVVDLRSSIAYVPQETALFHRTIRENIAYLKPDATDEQVAAAAEAAHATEFIDALPEKYDSVVGERGVKLSGGQRQRIALARAILADSPIVILDEATSALDVKTERLIQNVLDESFREKTLIVIAHRLSTIQHLDRIIVLDNGKIAEDGSHAQLLEKGGLYHELVQHQIASAHI